MFTWTEHEKLFPVDPLAPNFFCQIAITPLLIRFSADSSKDEYKD